MHKRIFSVMYAINIVAQSAVSLLTPAAVGFFIGWLLIRYAGAPEWLYAIFIPLGVLSGFVSMVRFVLKAATSLERLENQNKEKNRK